MIPKFFFFLVMIAIMALVSKTSYAQDQKDSSIRTYKNVVRYNLSGAVLAGFDKYIVLGYERVLSPRKSISVNFGTAALPKITSFITDSFQTNKEGDRKGFNVSVDYRYYPAKQNKFDAPHGLYIGPYYSYNQDENEKKWTHKKSGSNNEIRTTTDFEVHTFGVELGYQLLLWKRFSIDMVMVGPGLGFYKYQASFAGNTNLSSGDKEQLLDALKQLLTQKFPGMDYVFSDKQFNANGVLKTSAVGYRYILHIGYAF